MIREEEVFQIGYIAKTRGIRGEVELRYTDDILDRGSAKYVVLKLDGIFVPFFWEEYRFKGGATVILKLEGCDTETTAKQLVGAEAYYPYACVPEGEDGELPSLQALKGFRVQDGNGTDIGTIANVNDSTANVLLYLQRPDNTEAIIPYHDDFLLNFDLKTRTLQLQLPDGLLELNTP